jgi:UDP-glucuronate 4-epimerase
MSGGGGLSWVVTGGVGFIGYHVTRALLSRGDRVTVIDDFSDAPYPVAYKRRNQRDLVREFPSAAGGGSVGLPGVRVVAACVTDRRAIEPLFDGADGLIHLAGLAGVRPSIEMPARYAHVNVTGTAIVLEIAQAHGIRRVSLASSSSIYGNDTPLPAKEDEPAVLPESPYGASKRSAELVAQSIARHTTAMTVSALRFFTVYGPRQRPEMAITLFTRAMLAGKPITVFGDGSMRRDFTHVDDIVRGVLAASDGDRPGFRAYNLGSSAPIQLSSLIEALRAATGRAPVVVHAPVPPGDVVATYAETSRAQTELRWKPRVLLPEGLETVVNWVRENP